MADWANAIVEFKVLPKYKKSFETIFKRKERGNNRQDHAENHGRKTGDDA